MYPEYTYTIARTILRLHSKQHRLKTVSKAGSLSDQMSMTLVLH